MAVRGAKARADLTEMILGVFDGSFLNGKEIRIPIMDENEVVEIKLTLTCAKESIKENAAGVSKPNVAFEAAELTAAELNAVKLLAEKLRIR